MYDKIVSKISGTKSRGIIAIDGYDASGKTFFAKNLSETLSQNGIENQTVSIDNFHLPKVKRYEKGKDSAVGFYEDSYDYEAFINKTLLPFKNNSMEICTKIFDLETDSPTVLTKKIPENCWLIVEGIFLQRIRLKNFWDIVIYLKISEEESLVRNLRREFGEKIPDGARGRFFNRYICGQRLYHYEIQPVKLADFVVDNSEFMNPKLITDD